MITVFYYYWNKSESKMKKAEQIFYDVHKAIRFCWSMKNKKMILDGWTCYDQECNQLMNYKVNMSAINGYKIYECE